MDWREEAPPGRKTRLASSCLRIAAVVFFAASVPAGAAVVLYSLQGDNPAIILSLLVVTLCFVVGEWSITATRALEARKGWARDSAVFIFALCCLAVVFLPLGVVGLWALLSRRGRAEFAARNVDPHPPN
jgi:hypothetical protein